MISNRVNFSRRQYDLLVVGGGINGAAIANIAADNGLHAALVEKGDFAGGTSSQSTKLIHGGLRYLEHLEFDLVRESLRERFIQLKSAPHLVRPLEFVIPVYKSDKRPLWMMQLGIFLYDFLSGKYRINPHRFLTAQEVLKMNTGVKEEGLAGGVTYFDAQMDDARLCLENILSAQSKGADIFNYVEVESFLKENGKVVGAVVRDVIHSKIMEIRAKRVVCAVGPWTNRLRQRDNPRASKRIRATKGVHIIYKKKISQRALLLQAGDDNRFFFIIPWGEHSLIGTTDTDYTGNPDDVKVDDEDIDYLFKAAARFFPGTPFSREKIVTTFVGLRPLVHASGHPSRVSRKHVIEQTYSGIFYVLGGKYTTYRKIASDCLKKMFKNKIMKFSTDPYPLYDNGGICEDVATIARKYDVSKEDVQYLQSKYGIRYREVLALTGEKPELKKKICSCSPAIAAQVVYAVKSEMAYNLQDIVWRRLGLGYRACSTQQCREEIRKLIGE